MQKVVDTLKTVKTDQVGIIIYSTKKQKIVASLNPELIVSLASAAKLLVGYCVARWVENGMYHWNEMIEQYQLDPEEDSAVHYPHFQGRASISLGDLVEVMIACHDSRAADSIVTYCGGWEKINHEISRNFNNIHITPNPRDLENKGEVGQVLNILSTIYTGYQADPEIWKPVVNGLVRPIDHLEGIPNHFLNHMSGGLDNLVVDIGLLGEFNQHPFLYVLGASGLPNRYTDTYSDERIVESMKLLYKEYNNQRKVII
ncbi:serine hydrolase [Fictibacillus sp. b24]|uniref:serine hydrolase n=1 Tax=Fictibacillus sp. b24 TaxID=3055863 RepID=UPI0025A28580|nr:serine hydrolase [Fictibacillus sp. b24]MDM5317114.1 serine hydrolase [Fictibacillus sp. b24]